MKTKWLILICIFLIVTPSCSDDDIKEKITLGGQLTLESVVYDLTHGEIATSGEIVPNVYGFLVYLMSSSFTFSESSVSGTGEVIQLHFWTGDKESIQPGSYTYFNEDDPDINTFIIGFFSSWDKATYECANYYKGVSGTIIVERSGSYYTITANIIADKYNGLLMGEEPDGEPIETNLNITFNFTGKLEQKYFGK